MQQPGAVRGDAVITSDSEPQALIGEFVRTATQLEWQDTPGKLSASLQLCRQMRLEVLCQQILKNRGIVTSGRLQFISLAKVRRRAATNWQGLSLIVFEAVETALAEFLSPQDFSMRYQDENYLLLFAQDEGAAAQEKTAAIARRIHELLFQDETPDIRALIEDGGIAVLAPDEFAVREELILTGAGVISPVLPPADLSDEMPADVEPPLEVPVTQVETDGVGDIAEDVEAELGLPFRYQPIWEVEKDAIVSFLCLPGDGVTHNPIRSYENLFEGRSYSETMDYDFRVFEQVRRDLMRMQRENKQTMIICPLHYDTLYRDEGFQKFIHRCLALPEDLRKYLILMIWDPPRSFPVKDAFWFVAKLRRKLCRNVCINIPPPYDLNHSVWQDSGIDGLNFIVNEDLPEEETMRQLDKFCLAGQNLGIRTSILNVRTRSVVSIAVGFCAHYLSGDVISATVASPDSMFRFKYEKMYSYLEK